MPSHAEAIMETLQAAPWGSAAWFVWKTVADLLTDTC